MTYVLIHGGGDVGASWDLLAGRLRALGHDVVAPDLPSEDESAGLAEYADAVAEAVGDRTGLVVVAQSLGGFTAGLVADRLPVELVILIAAMIPAPGERAGEWWERSGYLAAVRELGERDESDIGMFLHDVPPAIAEKALAQSRDESSRMFDDPWPLAAWPDVPTRYIVCRDDRFLPAAFARRHARERLGIEPDEIDGGHCPFLSRPDELVGRLEAFRTATRRSRSADSRAPGPGP
jgi:pimeloyl-ACP methyl ester carboxylesterase